MTAFGKSTDARVPAIIALFPTEEQAKRMQKRLMVRHSRVASVDLPNAVICQPIYGIAKTDLPAPVKSPKPADGTTETQPKPPGRPRKK